MKCFQQLLQQRIPERIGEQSVDDVPPISIDFFVPRFINRTVEQLLGSSCPSDFEAHPRKVAPQMQRRAMKPLTAHLARGAPLSFQLRGNSVLTLIPDHSCVHVAHGPFRG